MCPSTRPHPSRPSSLSGLWAFVCLSEICARAPPTLPIPLQSTHFSWALNKLIWLLIIRRAHFPNLTPALPLLPRTLEPAPVPKEAHGWCRCRHAVATVQPFSRGSPWKSKEMTERLRYGDREDPLLTESFRSLGTRQTFIRPSPPSELMSFMLFSVTLCSQLQITLVCRLRHSNCVNLQAFDYSYQSSTHQGTGKAPRARTRST